MCFNYIKKSFWNFWENFGKFSFFLSFYWGTRPITLFLAVPKVKHFYSVHNRVHEQEPTYTYLEFLRRLDPITVPHVNSVINSKACFISVLVTGALVTYRGVTTRTGPWEFLIYETPASSIIHRWNSIDGPTPYTRTTSDALLPFFLFFCKSWYIEEDNSLPGLTHHWKTLPNLNEQKRAKKEKGKTGKQIQHFSVDDGGSYLLDVVLVVRSYRGLIYCLFVFSFPSSTIAGGIERKLLGPSSLPAPGFCHYFYFFFTQAAIISIFDWFF